METNEIKDAVTDISNVKFEIESPDIPSASTSNSQAQPSSTDGNGAATNTNDNANGGDSADQGTKDPIASDPSQPSLNNDPVYTEEPFDLDPEEFDSLISDAFDGKVNSLREINEKLDRLQEIEANPALLLKDDKQRKIFDYLNKYQGEDYNLGIQNFVKLQQMDVASMDAKTAIKELYMIKSLQKGISKEDAEMMFNHQFDDKYEAKGDAGKAFLNIDSIDAKLELQKMKEDALLPKTDKQTEDDARDRENYLTSIEEAFDNHEGSFKELTICELSENPEDDFTFPIPDLNLVKSAVANYGDYFNDRYLNSDGSWNAEQLKVDIAFTLNRDQILQKMYEHGLSAGKELERRERTNTPAGTQQPSNANQNAAPKTLEQSILNGMGVQ